MGTKDMKTIGIVAALGVAAIAQSPASATDISFTTTLAAHSTPLCLGSCHLESNGVSTAQSFSLDAGGPGQAVSLGTAWVDAGFGFDTDAGLDLTLTFTDPTVGSSGTASALAQYFRVGGFFHSGVTAGSITWDNPVYDFGIGGYTFELDLQDVSGWTLASSTPINGTLKLLSAPSDNSSPAVPEPASWALMLAGFGLVGGVMRSQRRQVSFG
jgi:hypothetical protein